MADPDAGAADNAPGPPRPPPSFAVPFDSAAAPWNVHKKEWLRARGLAWDGIATGALVYYHDDDDDDDDNNNNNNNEQAGERQREGGGSRTRVLLLQRSGDDEFPNLWETPGGAVDAEDPTILQGCARELWEETGLVTERVVRVVTEGRWGRKGWRGGAVEGEADGETGGEAGKAVAAVGVEDDDSSGGLALPYEQAGSVFQNETRTRMYCKFAFEVRVVKKNNTTTTTTAPPEVRLDPAEHQRFVWASEEEVRAGRCGSGRTLPFTVLQMRNMLLEGFRLRREDAERARKGRVGG